MPVPVNDESGRLCIGYAGSFVFLICNFFPFSVPLTFLQLRNPSACLTDLWRRLADIKIWILKADSLFLHIFNRLTFHHVTECLV